VIPANFDRRKRTMATINVTFNNYGPEAVVVVQGGIIIGTLPPVVPIAYTSTTLAIDPTTEVFIQQQVQGGLATPVCSVAVNTLREGDIVDDNISWGPNVTCNITPPNP
jgi:hypothetical protein